MRRAFTLLETLVAIGILAALMTGIYGLQAAAAQSVHYARNVQRGALLAKEQMLEIEWKLRKDGFAVNDMTLDGDFDDAEAKGYTWKAEIRRVKPEAFTLGGFEAASDNPIAAQFAPAMKFLGQSLADQVREVRLTVSWKEGSYTESFDVVTHIVRLGSNASGSGRLAPGSPNFSGFGSSVGGAKSVSVPGK
jgi:prepilin-type N-terminal cleavage/methylation domain-containing protein